MKAIKYKTMVYEGPMDWVHGGGRFIEEIFILQKNLCFNIDKQLNVFSSEVAREHKEQQEVEVPDDIAISLSGFLKVEISLADEKMKLRNVILKDNILNDRTVLTPNYVKEKL